MPKIPFKNMIIFKNTKNKLESFSSFILKTSMPPLVYGKVNIKSEKL